MNSEPANQPPPRQVIGASICNYAIDPQHNNVYFLLGSERKYPIWSESGKFSDFGGTLNEGETAEECAVREWAEETAGIVRWDDSQPPGCYRNDIQPLIECLKRKEYTFKVKTLIEHRRSYVTYLKQIPFDAGVIRAFQHVTQLLNHARNVIAIGGVYPPRNDQERLFFETHPAATMDENGNVSSINRCYTEKQTIQWISLPQLKEAIIRGEKSGGTESGMNKILVLRDTFRWRLKLIIPKLENIKQMRWEMAAKFSHDKVKACNTENDFSRSIRRDHKWWAKQYVPHHVHSGPRYYPKEKQRPQFERDQFQIRCADGRGSAHRAPRSKLRLSNRGVSRSRYVSERSQSKAPSGTAWVRASGIYSGCAHVVAHFEKEPGDSGGGAEGTGRNREASAAIH